MDNAKAAKTEKRNHGWRAFLRVIIFLILLACLLFYLNRVFDLKSTIDSDSFSGFYAEEENTLDGVYLGSSSVYRFWMPTRAYEEEGMCIYNMGTPAQPIALEKNIIIETLRTQPDMKLIIIDLRNLIRTQADSTEGYVRMVTDAMNLSPNRTDAVKSCIKYYKALGVEMDYDPDNYALPFTKYHNRWEDDLTAEDLKALKELPEYKGFVASYGYDTKKLSDPGVYEDTADMGKTKEDTLSELLDYCSGLDQKVIFISSPFYDDEPEHYEILNSAFEMCRDAGFEVLDFNSEPLKSQIGMDWSADYRDTDHTNLRGAMKYTDFLTDILSENMSLPDHRGDAVYESWDKAADRLNDEIIND